MPFAKKLLAAASLLLLLLGCGDLKGDLTPSGDDKRPTVEAGTIGPAVGQIAPEFTVSDTLGQPVSLAAERAGARGVVLYFTMWCPICDAHMRHMWQNAVAQYPDVRFLAVDYVSGSVADARLAQTDNGYATAPFTFLADTNQALLGAYAATMGTTVVVDAAGVITFSEDYRDGSRLEAALSALPAPAP
jgi:peroxiredoxin